MKACMQGWFYDKEGIWKLRDLYREEEGQYIA